MTKTLSLTVNGDRLNQTLEDLASIGKQADNTIRRLAFSPEDLAARQQLSDWMEAAGMSVRIDAGGNVIGRYPGQDPEARVLATGSHIDTVFSGGRFDGSLGVIAGLEVVRVLAENDLQLFHPFEVIAFADEERTMIGAKAIAGTAVTDPDRYDTVDNEPIQSCLERAGGDWNNLQSARRSREDIACFVELHVEQGGILEAVECEIGVVEGIVGQQRYRITIEGRTNHAGTTPMNMRRDALTTASHLILAIEDIAKHFPGDPVATVGTLEIWPNSINTVPGSVKLSLDMRDLSQDVITHMSEQLRRKIETVAVATRTRIRIRPELQVEPTLAADKVQAIIVESCKELDLSYTHLPSRASHDAQEIGRFTDMGMIFVPSKEGISHSGDEYTSPEQCIKGANVLLRSLLKLDQLYR
ncbi:amidase, hydantoinase/carbamoylase family [Synechococcus sp. PCC 7335]|uniref:Zn-dependent hydrolase n=1 Tax=Synechococcus sp. (strain ATCC 29403 / PCC 7335) TaxID=91464 RepID=UPI00017EB455|nr:Zn-dependent hydrolase [Synechococcus sp. PCC 7335]EDX85691.1 amidase, hydantoinase/carbamoylase family [Synechococcus sp. PCC 7335]